MQDATESPALNDTCSVTLMQLLGSVSCACIRGIWKEKYAYRKLLAIIWGIDMTTSLHIYLATPLHTMAFTRIWVPR